MTERVVCAIDCTPASRGAACAAIGMARALAMRLVFVHVASPGTAHERASAALDRSLAGLPIPDSAIRRIETGDPAEQVLAAAADEHAVLILTGTRTGRTGRARAFTGSVSAKVVEHSRVPVVIAPDACADAALAGSPPVAPEVVVGVDGSERGLAAVRAAGALARRARADVVLAHVAPPAPATAVGPAGVAPPYDVATLGQEVLDAARQVSPDPESVNVELRHGMPAEELERLAEERGSDLIVLGSSRPGRFRRLLLGATADRLAGSTRRLVMVVPCDPALADEPRPEEFAATA